MGVQSHFQKYFSYILAAGSFSFVEET